MREGSQWRPSPLRSAENRFDPCRCFCPLSRLKSLFSPTVALSLSLSLLFALFHSFNPPPVKNWLSYTQTTTRTTMTAWPSGVSARAYAGTTVRSRIAQKPAKVFVFFFFVTPVPLIHFRLETQTAGRMEKSIHSTKRCFYTRPITIDW